MVKCIYIYIYHIFIHLSIDGQLDCFHILASVNMVRERGVVQTAFGDDNVVFRFFLEHDFFQTLVESYSQIRSDQSLSCVQLFATP